MKFDTLHNLKLLLKAAQEGVYADTYLNRKLGRVGMTYTRYKNLDTMHSTVAPYLDEIITKENEKFLIEKCSKVFYSKAKEIADVLKIKISKINTNRGGYVLQEGEKAGQSISELSFTFDLKDASEEQATIFTCLMGDLGYQRQEAVICCNYLKLKDKAKANAIEISLPIKEVEKAVENLKKANITDYTIDKNNKCIKLLDFDLDNPDFDKIQKLTKILKKSQNYDEKRKTRTSPLQSRYLEIKDRQDFYERKLRDPNLGRGGRLYKLYSKALKVTKDK